MTAERGYGKELHTTAPYGRGCTCKEDFEHDGPCQNALGEKKATKCKPCSTGWHFPYPCVDYLTKGFTSLTTQCQRCGWDSSEHELTTARAALQIDSRTLPRRK